MQLCEGLFYPSALESSVSAMEMMAVAGRNTAGLIARLLFPGATGESIPHSHAESKQATEL